MNVKRFRPGEDRSDVISEAQIQAVAERLRQAAPDATIILFGSHARGEAREGSDLDILVFEPVVNSRHAEMVRLSDQIRDLRIPTDVLVISTDIFEEWAGEPGTVIHEAAKEGRILHAPAQAAGAGA